MSILEQDTKKWERFTGSSDNTPGESSSDLNGVQVLAKLGSLSTTVAQMVATTQSEDCKNALMLLDAAGSEVARLVNGPSQTNILATGLGKGAASGPG